MAPISLIIILALALVIIAFLFIRGMKALALVLCVLLLLGVAAMGLFPRFGMGMAGDGSFLGAIGDFFEGIFGGGAKAAEGPAQMIN